ncbi:MULTISPECIES: DUF3079 domain-containing protein [Burkholderiaceae]|nr:MULTISPECIES: DUF3079 domain-containing protein [Burkholderiaceae]AME26190.1 hypothetical protein AXG89_20010 [Burkholderia sp. PAMC 26561]
MNVKKFPTRPKHPERNCWECVNYGAADSMNCGNERLHPASVEVLGDGWLDWEQSVADEMAAGQGDRNDEAA